MTQLIDLGKLRFFWAGDWSSSAVYESNDVVKYGGNVYVYTHTLASDAKLPTDTAYWALMIEGFKFRGVYNPATPYRIGDGVAHGGRIYISILDGTGQTPPNATYWSQFADGIQYEGSYNAATAYQRNDVVSYGGSIYIAKQDGTNNLPTATSYWDKFVEGIAPSGVYNAATNYVPGQVVAYGANLYRALAAGSNNVPTNTSFWELFVGGTAWRGTYSAATTYTPNDIVLYGGNAYRARTTLSGVLPTVAASWELVLAGLAYQGVWSSATAYLIGQVVSYGGSLFQAKADHSNVNPTTTATWDKLVPGLRHRGAWASATAYGIDEIVSYGGSSFVSLLPHGSTTFATDLAAGRWQKFNGGVRWRGTWSSSTAYVVDDIVFFNVSTYLVTADHTSAASFTTDLSAGRLVLFAQGGNDVLPLQTGQSGKHLSTDGTALLWTQVLPAQAGHSGKVLTTNGSAASWEASNSIPADHTQVIGALRSMTSRGNNAYGWSSSGPWTSFYAYFNSNNDRVQAFNMLLGDGVPDGTSQQFYVGEDVNAHQRQLIFAHRERVGHANQHRSTYPRNETSYTPLSFLCLPVRNITAGPVTRTASWGYSSYWSSGMDGSAWSLWTPNASTYSATSGGTWTALGSFQGNSTNLTTTTASVTIPAQTTCLILTCTSAIYNTSYSFYDTNFFYNLSNFINGTQLVCDLRILHALHMARASAAASSSARPDQIYNMAATLFGDR